VGGENLGKGGADSRGGSGYEGKTRGHGGAVRSIRRPPVALGMKLSAVYRHSKILDCPILVGALRRAISWRLNGAQIRCTARAHCPGCLSVHDGLAGARATGWRI
jgi:hypothetical protein